MRTWSPGVIRRCSSNPVPRGLLTRRQGGSARSRTAPLVRVPRTLPRILSPGEADRLVAALRTHRDRAMVLAMLLAGLRRCEVLGLRFADVQLADRRLAVVEGKGGHHRIVPVANRFFDALGVYLHDERPGTAPTDRVFVVLKGPRRGLPLSAEGLDEILSGARHRAGLDHATCHELRHTCLTQFQQRRPPARRAKAARSRQPAHDRAFRQRLIIHDTTIREAFDHYQRQRVNIAGQTLGYDPDAPTAAAEWVKHNLSRIRDSWCAGG